MATALGTDDGIKFTELRFDDSSTDPLKVESYCLSCYKNVSSKIIFFFKLNYKVSVQII